MSVFAVRFRPAVDDKEELFLPELHFFTSAKQFRAEEKAKHYSGANDNALPITDRCRCLVEA